MQKKGELTSSEIAKFVLGIGGFVVVLTFVLVFLQLDEQSAEESCRLAILTRATAPEEIKRLAPLSCQTEKICLTTTGEDCDQFSKGEKVRKVDLPRNAEDAARKIEEISANEMFDCWSLTGEGKLDIYGIESDKIQEGILQKTFTETEIHPKCIICSRVALAKDLQQREDILSQVNVNEYLKKEQVPGSQLTYLQRLTDKQINSYPSEFESQFSSGDKKTTDQIAFMFSQILVVDEPIEAAVRAGKNTGLALATGALLTPAGRVVSILGYKVTIVSSMLLTIRNGALAYHQAGVNQEIAAVHCDKLTSAADRNRHGCSIITPIDWNDAEKINALCNGGIEGNI